MSIAYAKESFGSKLFTVTWVLDPTVPGGQVGDVFEASDCERLSIHATSDNATSCRLHFSNYDQSLGTNGFRLDIPNNVFAPYAAAPELSSIGQARFYWPSVLEYLSATANSRISLLFKEL